MTTATAKKTETLEILKEGKSDVKKLDPRVINIIPEFNDRVDYGNMDELKKSIKENGILQPVRGYMDNGVYYLIAGHRRVRVAQELINEGVEIRVPFISGKKKSMEEMLIDSFVSNDGKLFTPIEEATLINRLSKLGLEPKEISTKLGRSQGHISNMLILASIPTKLKKRIESDEISSTLVLKLIRKDKNITIDEVAETVEGMIEETKNEVSEENKSEPKSKKITEKTIAKAENKTDSFKELKKFFKADDMSAYEPRNKELFVFAQNLLDGKYSQNDFVELFGIETK